MPAEVDAPAVTAAPPSARVRVAQGLAFVALVAALVGALGPAERLSTTYSWPPETLPERNPERAWYTPLLLVRYSPDAISVDMPCALGPALSGAESPVTVVATARYPERVGGLAVRRSGDRLEIGVGDRVLDRVGLGSDTLNGGACSYRLRMADRAWTLERRGEVVGTGTLDLLPVVTGLFSSLDLRSEGAPSVEVTTASHATRTTTRQAIAWMIAAVAAAGALLLVALVGRPRRPWAVALELARRARANARAPDAVVGLLLLFWWIVTPAHFDDGWVVARERMFDSSGGFSHYYSSLGVNLPLDYWVEWLHHWVAESSLSLLVNRLPAVLCLAGAWVLCRWTADRIVRPTTIADGVPLWTLASVFVVVGVAWDVTVRPEPVTALLVTGVLACLVLFLERESTAAVAVAAALVALALSAHTTGIVSLAAVLVASPRLLRWARANAPQATAIVGAALGLFGLLLFVGSDLEQRRYDAQVVRTFSDHEAWRDEVFRYSLLSEHIYGTPLRRASVALIALAVLAFMLRRRREPRTMLDFPAAALTAGLLLFIAIPSKWPSHFGSLVGLAAAAFCCEAARVRSEASRSSVLRPWPFLAVAAVSGAIAWAWLEREQWNASDLMTLDWSPGFEASLPVATLAAVLPVVVLGLALVLARVRRTAGAHSLPWRVASWSGPLIAVPVLVFTAGMLLADTAKTSSWTLARQNLETLTGRDVACGLADDLVVPIPATARSLAAVGSGGPSAVATWVPPAPVAQLPRYALGPSTAEAASTPWFRLPPDRRIGVFVAGAPTPPNRLVFEWRRGGRRGIAKLEAAPLELTTGPLAGDTPWRFLAAGDLPRPPASATAVRLTHLPHAAPSAALAVTAPVTYKNERLVTGISRAEARPLVVPNLLMYFPCTRLPLLNGGTVDVPTHLVSWREQTSPIAFEGGSPFDGVLDLYEVAHLSLTDSENAPADIVAYAVDRQIPGAALAPPTASTSTS